MLLQLGLLYLSREQLVNAIGEFDNVLETSKDNIPAYLGNDYMFNLLDNRFSFFFFLLTSFLFITKLVLPYQYVMHNTIQKYYHSTNVGKGSCLFLKGEYQSSYECFRKALTINPDGPAYVCYM